jgi:cytoskeletal protein CcmA (bactofilin family)
VHIYGQVKGLVKARDVHLYASCKVEGTIMHELLSIEDGAFVDGKFKRTDKAIGERNRDADEAPLMEEDEASINLLQNLRLISKE